MNSITSKNGLAFRLCVGCSDQQQSAACVGRQQSSRLRLEPTPAADQPHPQRTGRLQTHSQRQVHAAPYRLRVARHLQNSDVIQTRRLEQVHVQCDVTRQKILPKDFIEGARLLLSARS